MSIDEIKKLNPKEKIILINDIWESLESENMTVESPSWHKQVLNERIKKMENNEARYMSLEELKNRWIHNKVFGLYRLLSKRFLYGIYYEINDDVVIIVAVLDLRQNPRNIALFISNRIR